MCINSFGVGPDRRRLGLPVTHEIRQRFQSIIRFRYGVLLHVPMHSCPHDRQWYELDGGAVIPAAWLI